MLDEAFKIDPFNVRVNNTLKVLEVLDGYETLETEHFRIKFDPAKDKLRGPLHGPVAGRSLSAAGAADGLRAAGEIAVRDFQPGQEHRRPRLVQRADGGPAAHPSDRRLRRQDRGPAIARRRQAAVQLGPRAEARVRARHQLAADAISTFRIGSPRRWRC